MVETGLRRCRFGGANEFTTACVTIVCDNGDLAEACTELFVGENGPECEQVVLAVEAEWGTVGCLTPVVIKGMKCERNI